MLYYQRTILVMLPVVALLRTTSAHEGDLEAFQIAVRSWIQNASPVIAEYESQGRGANFTVIGLDPVSGAWFSASGLGYSGRTPEGIVYFSQSRSLSKAADLEPEIVDSDNTLIVDSLSNLIPIAAPIALLHGSGGLKEVKQETGGQWVLSFNTRGPDPAQLPVKTMVFRDDGTPVRMEMTEIVGASGRPASSREYSFEDGSRLPLLIAKREPVASGPHPLRLVRVEYLESSKPEMFEIESVQAIARDNLMKTNMRLTQLSAALHESSSSGESPPPAEYAPHSASRMGLPLVITGVVVVAIGLFALIRTRMAR